MDTELLENYTRRFFKRAEVRKVLGDNFCPTSEQIQRLHRLFQNEGSPKQMENMLSTVAHFIDNDLNNYTGRYRRIKQMGCGTTCYSTLLRYGRKRYTEVYQEHAHKRTRHFANRPEHWEEKGLCRTEAEHKARQVQQERNRRATMKLTGTSLYTVRSKEYWIARGYTEQEAADRVRTIQTTNGLRYYENKYGADGKKLFEQRIAQWQKTLAENNDPAELNLKRGHSVESGLARGLSLPEAQAQYEACCERNRKIVSRPVSRISQKFCAMLHDQLGDGCYYADLSHEYRVGRYRVDFYHSPTQTAVEFYGDFWHANPKNFSAGEKRLDTVVESVWEHDRAREREIRSHKKVKHLFVVWEKDFRKNPQETVNNLIKEIEKCKNAK